MKKLPPIFASDLEQLSDAMRSIDISVPARSKGREPEHMERRSMCRLLSTLTEAKRISYPISLRHEDKPDFVLGCGFTEIGIEFTEVIHERYAAYCALAKQEFPDSILDPGLFRLGEAGPSTKKMREFLQKNQLTSPPHFGNEAEQEWAGYMHNAVEKKLKCLSKPDFRKFPRNWLSIYDNVHAPAVDLNCAIKLLTPLIQECWASAPHFDTIFIETERLIICLTSEGYEEILIRDLWSPTSSSSNRPKVCEASAVPSE